VGGEPLKPQGGKMKRGKKYQDKIKSFDKQELFDLADSVVQCKKMATANFDESIELHIRLGVDSRHADQQVRGAMVLPNGTGNSVRVCVIANGDKLKEAEEAGADFFGEDDLIEKIQKENWFDFDVLIAAPNMMGKVGRLGRVLGPKGLMPNPKSGTVTMDIANAVKETKAGKVEYRLDKANIIHVIIGKASFTEAQLTENLTALLETIKKAKPSASKGQYFKSVTITSTMGPGIKINTAKI